MKLNHYLDLYEDELVNICNYFMGFHQDKLITIRDGNACFRISENEFLVTKSGEDKSMMTMDSFMIVETNDNNKMDYNPKLGKPSIETLAHILALKATSKKFSMHVHPPKTIALFAAVGSGHPMELSSVLNNEWPELFRYTKVGETVPFLDPGSEKLHRVLEMSFEDLGTDIVVMQNHGILTVGDTPEACYEHITRLEHISGILLDILAATGGKLDKIMKYDHPTYE